MNKEKRILFFDCARVLCTIWITCIYHFSNYINFTLPDVCYWITIGGLATFMTMSGYFVGGYGNIVCVKDIFCFYKKRIIRIWPLLILSCTSLYLLFLINKAPYITSISQLLLSCFGLAGYVGKAPLTVWFISILIPFYAITPYLIVNYSSSKFVIKSILVEIVLLCIFYEGGAIRRKNNIFIPLLLFWDMDSKRKYI